MMPAQTERVKIDLYPSDPHNERTSTRLQVKVANATKDALTPMYRAAPRKAAARIVDVAEGLGLLEALRLLSEEDRESGVGMKVVWVTPSRALLEKASRFYVGPHVLIRAAAVKIAKEIEAGASPIE